MTTVGEGFVRLDQLPTEDPLRNVPLHQIRAEYQWMSTERPMDWHRVTKSFKIGNNTFNQLGETWTRHYAWRVAVSPAPR